MEKNASRTYDIYAFVGSLFGIIVGLIIFGPLILFRWLYYVMDCGYWLPDWFCELYSLSIFIYLILIALSLFAGIRIGQKNYQSKQSNQSAIVGGIFGGAISMYFSSIAMIALQLFLVFLVDRTPFENF